MLVGGDFDVTSFRAKLEAAHPKAIAFNGKKAASVFYERPTAGLDYGRQAQVIGEAVVFVFPSTSGSARGFWDEGPWQALVEFVSPGG